MTKLKKKEVRFCLACKQGFYVRHPFQKFCNKWCKRRYKDETDTKEVQGTQQDCPSTT